jgi:DNA invertase Pin-like site-specific DNA recombinase
VLERIWAEVASAAGTWRARAVARGVKLGRGFALNPEQRRQALARLDAGEASREIARTFNVAHTTIGRLAMR